jgi:hypothetical protein
MLLLQRNWGRVIPRRASFRTFADTASTDQRMILRDRASLQPLVNTGRVARTLVSAAVTKTEQGSWSRISGQNVRF